MKLFILLTAVACLQTSARGYSQNVSLSLTNAPLEQAFKEIKKQTGYRFIYAKAEIQSAKPVTISVTDRSLDYVLQTIFSNQPLNFVIEEKHVVIRKKVEESVSVLPIDITGKVVNENGEAVVNATVTAKSSKRSTTTDKKGEFVLNDILETEILIVTSVEIETVEISTQGKTYFAITAKKKIGILDETIIKGYYTTSKRLNTGSVSKISSKEIESQPVANPLSAIQGRASGVFVNTQNGLPGGNITIQIRGKGSINAGIDPLYVVDGVPFISTPLNSESGVLTNGITGAINPLNSINPSDIESIEILKDADVTAIYGSRGANGVILITTKKGKAGKTKIEVTFYQGISVISQMPRLLNLGEYLAIRKEAFLNDNITPTSSNAPDLISWDTTKSTNWMQYLLGSTAQTTQLQAVLSGGSQNTNFRFSANYRKEGTVLPGDQQYYRTGGQLQFHHNSDNNMFSADFTALYTGDNNRQLSSSIFSGFILPPNIPLYTSDGSFSWSGFGDIHPVAVLERKSKSLTDNLLTNIQLRYTPIKGLSGKLSIGYNKIMLDQVMTYPIKSLNPNQTSISSADFGTNKNRTFIIEPQLEYSFKKHNLGLNSTIGASWQNSVREGLTISASDFSNEDMIENPAAGSQVILSVLQREYKYVSIFSRTNLNYHDRYVLNITMRRDGSSRFGPDRQFGNFGSIGTAWIFSNEAFSKKSFPFFSYGKIRSSYGITGNDLISDYQYLSSYTTGVNYQNTQTITPTRIANSEFGWETSKKFEVALEMGLFENKIMLTAAWYRNTSSNQLIEYPIPYSSGPFGSYQANFPALVENKGWEFDFLINLIKNGKISWSILSNITVPKNRLLKYPGLEQSSFANKYTIGNDLSIRMGYDFIGIDPQTGIPTYADINNDGIISSINDYVIIGRTSPYFFGGAGSNLILNRWEFSMFFQFSKQYAQGTSILPGMRFNHYEIANTRWRKPGDVTDVPKATTRRSPSYSNMNQSDATFFNATYLRLKNVSVSYTIRESILSKYKLQSLKLYAECQNVFTLKKRANLYDPETANQGIAPLMILIAGIHLTF